jgi:hypothetical protein
MIRNQEFLSDIERKEVKHVCKSINCYDNARGIYNARAGGQIVV